MATVIQMRVHQSETELHPDPDNPGELLVRSHVKLEAVDQAVFPGAVFEVRVAGLAAQAFPAGALVPVTVGDPV